MRVILGVVAAVVMVASASGQSAYTTVTVLEADESNYVVCASGSDVTYYHPLRADGAPDMRKLVVECPVLAPGIIWAEGQPVSPLAQPAQAGNEQSTIYLPLIGE